VVLRRERNFGVHTRYFVLGIRAIFVQGGRLRRRLTQALGLKSTRMKQYDVIKLTAIRNDRFKGCAAHWQRAPAIGDIGTILEIYPDAFEVECSDSTNGSTIWLAALYPDEMTIAPM